MTWIMVQSELTYYLGNGKTKTIRAGQIDVASKNYVHGCINEGNEDAIFVSIYSSRDMSWFSTDYKTFMFKYKQPYD